MKLNAAFKSLSLCKPGANFPILISSSSLHSAVLSVPLLHHNTLASPPSLALSYFLLKGD